MKNTEDFLREICPNHTDKSKWNKSELLHILDKYQSLQLLQTDVSGQSEQLPCFLYKDERGIFIGYHGDTNVTEEWNDYLKTR
jgi:hypothetical protein